jgi:hypothetical protein
MSQINPLADYAKHRSADAFAQIVEQYQRLIGPMLYLINPTGNRIEPYEDYNLGQTFFVGPAHYHVLVDRAGATPLNLETDILVPGQSVDLIEP